MYFFLHDLWDQNNKNFYLLKNINQQKIFEEISNLLSEVIILREHLIAQQIKQENIK